MAQRTKAHDLHAEILYFICRSPWSISGSITPIPTGPPGSIPGSIICNSWEFHPKLHRTNTFLCLPLMC